MFLLFTGSVGKTKRELNAEKARLGREKRKGSSVATPEGKRPKVVVRRREPPSKPGESSKTASPAKTKVPSGASEQEPISAIPISVAPPVGTPTSEPKASEAATSEKAPVEDKGKGKLDEPEPMQVNFTLPAGFLADGELERRKLFPHLSKYLLPTFENRYGTATVDDTGSFVCGLTFLVSFYFFCFSRRLFIFCSSHFLLFDRRSRPPYLSMRGWRRSVPLSPRP